MLFHCAFKLTLSNSISERQRSLSRNRRNSSPAVAGFAGAHRLPQEHGEQVPAQRNEDAQRAEEQPRPGAGQHPGTNVIKRCFIRHSSSHGIS